MDRNKLVGHIMAALCVAIWGSTYVVSKHLMDFVTPLQLMTMRFGISMVLLWILCPKWHFSWKEEGWFLLMGLFANTIYFIAENTALTMTNASDVSIIVSSSPLIIAVLLMVFAKDRLSKVQTAGYILAFVGVVLVILNGSMVLEMNPMGYMLALCAAVCWAIYALLLRRFDGDKNGLLISRKILTYGFFTSLPIMLWEGAPFQTDMLLQPGSIAAILFLGTVASGLCYIMWNTSAEKLSVITTSLYMDAMPMVTLVVAFIFTNEAITLMAVAGIVLVILGFSMGNFKTEGTFVH